jgi:hypothetical protein
MQSYIIKENNLPVPKPGEQNSPAHRVTSSAQTSWWSVPKAMSSRIDLCENEAFFLNQSSRPTQKDDFRRRTVPWMLQLKLLFVGSSLAASHEERNVEKFTALNLPPESNQKFREHTDAALLFRYPFACFCKWAFMFPGLFNNSPPNFKDLSIQQNSIPTRVPTRRNKNRWSSSDRLSISSRPAFDLFHLAYVPLPQCVQQFTVAELAPSAS